MKISQSEETHSADKKYEFYRVRKRWPIDRGGQIESHTANYTLMDIAAQTNM